MPSGKLKAGGAELRKKRPSFPKAAWLLRELVLFAGCRGRSRRRGRCAAVAAAGIHDDAGAFPGFNEAFAGVGAVELQGEVVHVGCQLHEGGGVGFHFAQQGALVDDLSARRVRHFAEGGDGGGERRAEARHGQGRVPLAKTRV